MKYALIPFILSIMYIIAGLNVAVISEDNNYVWSTAIFKITPAAFTNNIVLNIQWGVPSWLNISDRVPVKFNIQRTGSRNSYYYVYIRTYAVTDSGSKVLLDSFSVNLGINTVQLTRYIIIPQSVVRNNGEVKLVVGCENGNTDSCSIQSSIPISVPVLNYYEIPSSILINIDNSIIQLNVNETSFFNVYVNFSVSTEITRVEINADPFVAVGIQGGFPMPVQPYIPAELKFIVYGISTGAGYVNIKIWYRYGITERYIPLLIPVICQQSNITETIEQYRTLVNKYTELLQSIANTTGYTKNIEDAVELLQNILQKIDTLGDLETINNQITQLKSKTNDLSQDVQQLRSKLNSMSTRINSLNTMINNENNEVKNLKIQINKINRDIGNFNRTLSELKTNLSRLIMRMNIIESREDKFGKIHQDTNNIIKLLDNNNIIYIVLVLIAIASIVAIIAKKRSAKYDF